MQVSNKVKYGAILGGTLLIVYGVYKYIKVQSNLLKDFDYRIKDFFIDTLNFNDISGTLIVEFHNKSNVQLLLTNFVVDFYINGAYVGFVEDANEFSLRPNSKTDLELQYYLDPNSIYENTDDIFNLVFSNYNATIQAKGYAKIKSGFIRATLPIDYSTTIREILL
jgi:LEA14-like dessication related protein